MLISLFISRDQVDDTRQLYKELEAQGLEVRSSRLGFSANLHDVERGELNTLSSFRRPETSYTVTFLLQGSEFTRRIKGQIVVQTVADLNGRSLVPSFLTVIKEDFGQQVADFRSEGGIVFANYYPAECRVELVRYVIQADEQLLYIVKEPLWQDVSLVDTWRCKKCAQIFIGQRPKDHQVCEDGCDGKVRWNLPELPVDLKQFANLMDAVRKRAGCGSFDLNQPGAWCGHVHYGSKIPRALVPPD